MSARTVKILAVLVTALFVAMFALNSRDRNDSAAGSDLLFPELKSRLNDLNSMTVTDAGGAVTLQREGDEEGASEVGRWVSPNHGGYPADTGKLRQLLLALADARKLEQKTSDPALYDRLGVGDPRESGGNGVLVSAKGDNAAISLILGDTAQREFRYARIPEEAQSWLIDQNPVIPAESAGWLLADVVDIEASRIRSASIRHADGEVITIGKPDEDAVNFEVEDIPEGRELRYPSVANGIAGVLGNLTLEDVRKAGTATDEPLATAEFSTFDGLDIRVAVLTENAAGEDEDEAGDAEPAVERWITVSAAASPADETPDPAGTEQAGAQTGAEEGAANAGQAPPEGSGENAATKQDPADDARQINDRVSGWAYRIPDYKADQLTRRWDDLLSDVEEDDDSGS